MRTRQAFVITTLLSFSLAVQAQDYKTYKWIQAALHPVKAEWADYPAVIILHNRIIDLVTKGMNGNIRAVTTEHRIVHVNSNAGVERYNKIYLPVREDQSVISFNVRSIDPQGKVTELNMDNLKELKNLDGHGGYRIFAVEGLVAGGEVEYLYSIEGNPSGTGRFILQSEVPIGLAKGTVTSPGQLAFEGKSYNGLIQPEVSEGENSRNRISVRATDVPALPKEEYSPGEALAMHMDYRVARNKNYELEGICRAILENTTAASASARVRKLLKTIDMENMSSPQKVKAVENLIKTTFTLKRTGGDEYVETKSVIENRAGTERGMLKLFMSCWKEMGIPFDLVLCSDRTESKLDPLFPSYSDISTVLIYFPFFNQYLSPALPYYRLGPAPTEYAGSTAVHIKLSSGGDWIAYAGYEVKQIPLLGMEFNHLGVKASVKFGDRMDQLNVDQETIWQGYTAFLYRGIYFYGDKDRKEEFLKGTTLSAIDNPTVISRTIEGEDPNLSGDLASYFRVKTRYTATSLVEQAGEDYLFSIGKLIGRQSELYQEKERVTDIEFRAIANYNHELVLEVPKGYKVTGLEALNINHAVSNGKEDVMKFSSGYELSGNILTVKAIEYYKVLQLPKSKYQDFRAMINSAADFSKVVLVLTPDK